MVLLNTEQRVRGTYLGGRDIAAIVGVDAFATGADVYAKIVHGYRAKRTPRMLRGLILEPGLIDFAAEYRGRTIVRDRFYRDDNVPFFCCSVDGAEPDVARPSVLHETKTTKAEGLGPELSERWGPWDSDDVEKSCMAQVQWEMGITGARETHVWLYCVDRDEDPHHYLVGRNRQMIDDLREQAEAFWYDHIVPKKPPRCAPYDDDAAHAMYPSSIEGKSIEPTVELVMASIEYAAARMLRDAGIKAMESAGAAIKSILGDAERCHWKASGPRPKGTVSWKASRLPEPVTNWEQVAHELGLKFKIPGEVFHGLVIENTRRPWTSRQLRVTITVPKKGTKQ